MYNESTSTVSNNSAVRESLSSDADIIWRDATTLTEEQTVLLRHIGVRELLNSDVDFTWKDALILSLSYASVSERVNAEDLTWRGAITLTPEQAAALNSAQAKTIPSSKIKTLMTSISPAECTAATASMQKGALKTLAIEDARFGDGKITMISTA